MAVDTAADIAESVPAAAVVAADIVAVVAVVGLASLAVFDSCYKTSFRRQPERHTWDIDTAASHTPFYLTFKLKP